jgi:muramoyltetrapeptide carboxypeptidase
MLQRVNALKPPKLKRGDVIGIIAPASAPVPAEKIDKGARYFEGLGYRVKLGANVRAVHGHLAGTDAQRVGDLNAMLNDPEVKAIIAVRGGYGTPRLLPFVDYDAVRRQPKILVGYSDLTGLQLALFAKTGLITFSGPMSGVEFWNQPDSYTEEHFWRALTSSEPVGELRNPPDEPARGRRPGVAEGILLGGNLSLVVANLGTPFHPSMRDALLVLEEIEEEPYRFDRMLTHLRNAGVLDEIKGLLLGHFTNCVPADPKKPHLTAEQVFEEVIAWTKVPVLDRLQYGHITKKLTLPIGVRARMDAERGSLALLESAVV